MTAESAQLIVMFRYASPVRRKGTWDTMGMLNQVRRAIVGIGPDTPATMFNFLKTGHLRNNSSWLMEVRFKEDTWIHCIASDSSIIPIRHLAQEEKLQVIVVWFDAQQNRTHAQFYKRGTLAADFVAEGRGDVPLKVILLTSTAHPKSLLKKCSTLNQAIDAFMTVTEASLRDLKVIESDAGLELRDARGKKFPASKIDMLSVTYYAPSTADETSALV